MPRIFITGAAGFIGSHLVDFLLRRGDLVCGYDEFNDFYDRSIKRANLANASQSALFSLTEADICDRPALRAAIGDCRPDVIVHLAARAGVRPSLQDPNLYHRANVIGTQEVLDACIEFKPSHLVMASSSSVYGGIDDVPFHEGMDISRPISPYAATKRMNELQAHVYHHVYGLRVTLLRFFTVYGPRQRPDMAIHKFTKLIHEGRPVPMFGDGSTRRDYTYVDDVIDGVVKAIDRPLDYEILNLGESETTTLRRLVDLIAAALGKQPNIEQHPMQPGDVEVTYASIEKARLLLGYDPRTKIEIGVPAFVNWYLAHKNPTGHSLS